MTTASTGIPGFGGEIVDRVDPGYDGARQVWNAMHDRRPALIARCATPARRGRGDRLRPRATACRSPCAAAVTACPATARATTGIVIDLRAMNAVARRPGGARRATVGGGALLGEVDRATQAHGLVVPAGVVSHTGAGGLTLGGGVGRLMRRFGLTIDSLLSAEVVTADGRILHASETENPDLFWGLRGGGGNFGVVTEFEFALHELRELLDPGHVPPARATSTRCWRAGREAMAAPDAPDELLWTSFLRKAPPLPWVPPELVGRPGHHVAGRVVGRRSGEGPASASSAIAARARPRRRLARARCRSWTIQTMTDEIFADGKRTYIKAGFARALSDELIDDAARSAAARSARRSRQIEVLALGGAIARVPPEATAFPHRDAAWLINLPAMWEDPRRRRGRDRLGAAQSFARAAARTSAGGATSTSWTATRSRRRPAPTVRRCARLRTVKRAYDPDNVFRLNQNIRP